DWSGPQGFKSKFRNPVIPNVSSSMSGVYSLNAFNRYYSGYDTTHVTIYPRPFVEIQTSGTGTRCFLDSLTFTATEGLVDYTWSTGEKTESIVVCTGGLYWVEVVDTNGCTNIAEMEVIFDMLVDPIIEIIGNHPFCEGEGVILKTRKNYEEYFWSTRSISDSIFVNRAGAYRVTVTDSNGCTGVADIRVFMRDKPVPLIETVGNNPFCENDSVELKVNQDYLSYLWSTGDTSKSIIVTEPGIYSVEVVDSSNCTGQSEVLLEYKILKPNVEIIGNHPFCDGDSVILKTTEDYDDYLWSNGETGRSIIVREAGDYEVSVIDSNGCTGKSDKVLIRVYSKPEPIINGKNPVCENMEASYHIAKVYNTLIKWSVAGGEISSGDQTEIITIRWGMAGKGIITVKQQNLSTTCIGYDTLIVDIENESHPKILPENPVICDGGTVTLTVEKDYDSYYWSTGDTTKSIVVDKEGVYNVTTEIAGSCKGKSDDIFVRSADNPEPVILGGNIFCPGQSIRLYVEGNYENYEWSTGATTSEITISEEAYYSVMVTDTNGCMGKSSVFVSEFITEIEGLYDINYHDVKIGTEAEKTLFVQNTGDVTFRIEDAVFRSNSGIFSIETIPLVPVDLNPGELFEIIVKFRPDLIIDYPDTLYLDISEPCIETRSVLCSGRGKDNLRSLVWFPDTTASIGTRNYVIPLKAKFYTDTTVSDLRFNAEISFAADSYFPDHLTKVIITDDRIENQKHSIKIKGTADYLSNREYILAEMSGMVLLGDKELTALTIEAFQWEDNTIQTAMEDGSLEAYPICNANLSKIQLFNTSGLYITPNPASSFVELRFESAEKGKFELNVFSVVGNKIESLEWNKEIKGPETIILDLKKFTDGYYLINLKTPAAFISRQLLIIK
ncbi:MAG: hypothetical protein KAW93_01180, partial [Methanogenium sp.]|nr:hypothetical protein [Methanogenium sp.]